SYSGCDKRRFLGQWGARRLNRLPPAKSLASGWREKRLTDIQQVVPVPGETAGRFRAYGPRHLDMLVRRAGLGDADVLAIRAVATVLPFRTNSYVVEELIDWDAAPDDPIYRLVFPQPDMLPRADVDRMAGLLRVDAPAQR